MAALVAAVLPQALLAENLGDVLRADLTPGWSDAPGRHVAGVQLTLAPGWKTYWRAPGDAGIPPSFDWSGSQNLRSVRIDWPAPSVFHTNGMQSVGYKGSVLLPFEVVARDPAAPVVLKLRMDLGICKDVCMPATVELGADLSQAGGAAVPALKAALRARPATPREAGLKSISCTVEPIADGLRVTARIALPRQGSGEAVVIEPGLPGVWVSDAEVTREGGALIAAADLVPPSGEPFGLDRSGMIVTVISDGGAVQIPGCPAP